MDETTEQPEQIRSSRGRLATVVGSAAVISVTLVFTLVVVLRPPTVEVEAPKTPEPISQPTLAPAIQLTSARNALGNGNAGEAYRHFRRLIATNSGFVDDTMRYELAVCAEGVGDVRTAIQQFEHLASVGDSNRLQCAAVLGLARVRLREQQFAAVDHLLTARLNSGMLSIHDSLQAEAEYLRAIALARIACDEQLQPLLTDTGLIAGRIGWSIENVLKLSELTPADRPAKTFDSRTIESVGEGLQSLLAAQLPRQSIKATIDSVATVCGMTTHWSAAAQIEAEAHTAQLHVQHLGLPSLLDRILNTAGLAWKVENSLISIVSTSTLPAKTRKHWQANLAKRALWDAVTGFSDSRYVALAMLNLGNLDVQTAPASADARYQELLRQQVSSNIRMAALFNRGKVALKEDRPAAAAKFFLAAAEHGNGTLPDAVALVFVGRLKLEIGSASAAINPLLRAVGHLDVSSQPVDSKSTPVERDDALAIAVQTLAIAWLESDNPLAANRILMRHRPLLQLSSHRDSTAFLTALANYQSATKKRTKLHEGRTLIAALTHVRPDHFFCGVGTVLIGESWDELGLSAQMETLFRVHLQTVKTDSLRNRILHSLVGYHQLVGQETRVNELLSALEAISDSTDGDIQIARAEHALRIGNSEQSLHACLAMLNSPDANHTAVLQVMGRVYEREENYVNAAACFAGMIPADSQNDGSIDHE